MKDVEIGDLVFDFIKERRAYEGFQLHYHILSKHNIRLGVAQTNSILNQLEEYSIIERKESTTSENDAFLITEIGWETVLQNESYSKFLESVTKEKNHIKTLEKQKLILENEKLEYERTIRNLKEELSISTLLKNWWWLIASAIALGVTLGYRIVN